jgi:glycerol-3-phosphate dehydrogenase
VVANRVAANGFVKDDHGRISALSVTADGETFEISTKAVVNAAGVWADDVRQLDSGTHPDSIRPAKGVHIAVPHRLVQNTIAAVIPVPNDKRSVFVVREGDLTYIGTTDTDYKGSIDDPQCTTEDIEYLLGAINSCCINTIAPSDIVGSWAGLRPLVKSASSGRTADLSRGHNITESDTGLVTITGGKLTTYRHMAADTVNVVVHKVLRTAAPAGAEKSRTKRLRLRGADGYTVVVDSAHRYGVSTEVATHLSNRYGGEAIEIMSMIREDRSLGEPLVVGLPYVAAEAIFAVRYEMARSVDDVLSRRTRARLWGRDDAADAASRVATLIAKELGWSAEEAEASAAEFRALCEHERVAAELPHVHLADVLHGPPAPARAQAATPAAPVAPAAGSPVTSS